MNENYKLNMRPIHCWTQPADLQLPIRESPVTFAVRINDYLSSPWKVKTVREGSVYIFPRDVAGNPKISLHESGRQHIRFDLPGVNEKVWEEPPRKSPLLASVKVLFPPWSVGMGPSKEYDAQKVNRQWARNQIFIEGEENEDVLISVCFFLAPPGVTPQLPPYPPMAVIAVLLAGANKELYVVARREHRPNIREELEAKLNESIKPGASQIGHPRFFFGLLEGEDGRPYVTRVSAEMKSHGLKLQRAERMRIG